MENLLVNDVLVSDVIRDGKGLSGYVHVFDKERVKSILDSALQLNNGGNYHIVDSERRYEDILDEVGKVVTIGLGELQKEGRRSLDFEEYKRGR